MYYYSKVVAFDIENKSTISYSIYTIEVFFNICKTRPFGNNSFSIPIFQRKFSFGMLCVKLNNGFFSYNSHLSGYKVMAKVINNFQLTMNYKKLCQRS